MDYNVHMPFCKLNGNITANNLTIHNIANEGRCRKGINVIDVKNSISTHIEGLLKIGNIVEYDEIMEYKRHIKILN